MERTGKHSKDLIKELIELSPVHYNKNNVFADLLEVLTDEQKIRMKNEALNETIGLLKCF